MLCSLLTEPRSFIPEGTAARIHFYSVHRDPRNFFPHTNAFWPDRWLLAEEKEEKDSKALEKAELIHNPSAFIPFSFGPSNCVGKNLALLEMRMVLCYCIQELEFTFADDLVEDPGRWEREILDMFVMQKGKLPAIVRERTGK